MKQNDPINIILDTDIGTDSDDVGAMMVLHGLRRQGLCRVLAVTSCTTRRDGAAIIDVINRYYDCCVPIGGARGKGQCDTAQYGTYSRAVSYMYDNDYRDKDPADAVTVLRRALVQSKEKVRLVSIGSFANIAALLRSGGDDCLPLTGTELVREKVSDMYSMAGNFCGSTQFCGSTFVAECNVMMSLPDSIYVAQHFPCPVTYSPFELGVQIRTGEKLLAGADNPMKMAYYVHNITARESWDPVTTYAAIAGEALFCVRENVTVSVDEKGVTTFREGGKDRILTDFKAKEDVRQALEDLMCV